jgi:hypothetical protein
LSGVAMIAEPSPVASLILMPVSASGCAVTDC